MSAYDNESGVAGEHDVYFRFRALGCELRSDLIGGDYMRRWTLRTPIGMLRLHHILRGDDDREFHDHPFDFTSIILAGGYVEHRPGGESKVYLPGGEGVLKHEDIERLEVILTLTRDMGVNLAGVEVILGLRRKLVEAVERLNQMEELLHSEALEELKARMEDATAEQAALIPARAAKLVRVTRRDR